MIGPHRIDTVVARRRVVAAMDAYHRASAIPREIETRLWEHLEPIKLSPSVVLELGAGRSGITRRLAQRFEGAIVVALDHALELLSGGPNDPLSQVPSTLRLCADAGQLPLASASVGLLVATSILHWCAEPLAAIAQWARVLEPGGLLLLTTFGPDTLRELRAAFAAADNSRGRSDGAAPPMRVHPFADMHDLGDVLAKAGFTDVVMETERITLEYARVCDLWRDLKALGATNASGLRARGLLGRSTMQMVEERLEALRANGRIPCTIELVYAHAWRTPTSSTEAEHDFGRILVS